MSSSVELLDARWLIALVIAMTSSFFYSACVYTVDVKDISTTLYLLQYSYTTIIERTENLGQEIFISLRENESIASKTVPFHSPSPFESLKSYRTRWKRTWNTNKLADHRSLHKIIRSSSEFERSNCSEHLR